MAARRYRSGFLVKMGGITLIELVIVMAAIAIITAIAVPNYQDYVSRSRRADAMIALQRVANEQEQAYFDDNTYTTSFADLNMPNTSPDGYYTLSVNTTTAAALVIRFEARAIPVAGSSQAGTGRFNITSTGQKGWDPDEDGIYQCDWDDANRGGSTGC